MEKSLSTKDMIMVGLMTALVFVAGSIIKIPTFGGGFVHIGDCMIFVSAVMLGAKKGAFASGVGMFLVDVFAGYMIWAPFTLVIKAVMAFLAGTVIEKSVEKNLKVYLIAFLLAGAFMIVGYFIVGIIMGLLFTEGIDTIVAGMVYASHDILLNVAQIAVGVVIALPLSGTVLRIRDGK